MNSRLLRPILSAKLDRVVPDSIALCAASLFLVENLAHRALRRGWLGASLYRITSNCRASEGAQVRN
jgi:hypothetical protein